MDIEWISCHLYFNGSLNAIAVDFIKPFIESQCKGRVSNYFFIRYWDNGPHIRLRLKPLTIEVGSELVDGLHKLHDVLLTKGDQQNTRIAFIPYEPEVSRYGGPQGILVAEEHFRHSSDVVLEGLSIRDYNQYESVLGLAIQLHTSFVFSTGLSQATAACLYEKYFRDWCGFSFLSYGNGKENSGKEETIRRAFEDKFQNQEQRLSPMIKTLLQRMEEGAEFEDDWFQRWLNNVSEVEQKLKTLEDTGKLSIDPPELVESIYPEGRRIRTTIYESYIHMLNNRLGIRLQDEAYLAFLMMKCFQKFSKEINA